MPEDNGRLLNMCGQLNSHLYRLEKAFDVLINMRGHSVSVSGSSNESLELTRCSMNNLYQMAQGAPLSDEAVELAILEASDTRAKPARPHLRPGKGSSRACIDAGKLSIKLRGDKQLAYVDSIHQGDVTIGVGPAGTGKTYLAIACAAEALAQRFIDRIILVRPAVEAGEKLGFLPGDLQQKVDPYLRPMFDSLHLFLGEEDTTRKLGQGKIEIASLAYMRGRTLSHSFIVMDEAQNATHNQMLMLLTRIGVDSTVVVNGDISQVDLPGRQSGLVEAIETLKGVRGVRQIHFGESDIHRSQLVRDIVRAYQERDEAKADQD